MDPDRGGPKKVWIRWIRIRIRIRNTELEQTPCLVYLQYYSKSTVTRCTSNVLNIFTLKDFYKVLDQVGLGIEYF
jgi:hypothetical protein